MTRFFYADIPLPSGFTLEALADRYLGSPERWRELVVLNNLRYPYLSEEPLLRAGPVLAESLVRAHPHLAGQDSTSGMTLSGIGAGEYLVPLTSDMTVTRGQRALFISLVEGLPQWHLARVLGMVHPDPDGPLTDPAVQATYDLATRATWPAAPVLLLDEPIRFSFTQGNRVTLHPDPVQTRLRVIGPGDSLRVPITQPGADLLPVDLDATDLLGTDVAISEHGELTLGDDGDLATATGRANLRQALWLRLQTPLGELPLHPDYGDQLQHEVGATHPELFMLAHAYARAAVISDPRISRIATATVTFRADMLDVQVVAVVAGFDQLVSVQTILPAGGPRG